MSPELFLLKAFIIYSLNSKSINWSFVCQLCKRWMCDPVNGRLFTVYLSSISVAMVTVITLRRNYWVNNLFFQSQLELYLFYIFFLLVTRFTSTIRLFSLFGSKIHLITNWFCPLVWKTKNIKTCVTDICRVHYDR